jgi:hypothetical protein
MREHLEKESGMRFLFDDEKWSLLIKYDEQTDYKKILNAVHETKAVDFMGILNNEILSLIEVKNFRGHRIENKPRLDGTDDPLEVEIAQKVRDTIAGIVGAARNSTHLRENWVKYCDFLLSQNKKTHVILWLEEDEIPLSNITRTKRERARGGTLTQRLKQKMNWLTPNVLVSNITDNPYSESLKVEFLPEKTF